MSDICPKCGLPKETLCVCETIAKEEEKITISMVTRRYGKAITVIQGLSKDLDTKKILKDLKTKLACGGTLRNGDVELQGNHKEKAKELLIKLGFPAEQIEVS